MLQKRPVAVNGKEIFNMAIFDDLTQKAKDVAAVAADKAKDAAELTKIMLSIASEQREMDKNYRSIGEWFVNEYEGEIPDAVRDLVEAVVASKSKIAELEAAKAAIKEADPQAEAEAEEPAAKTCPICGHQSDSKFCPRCGAPMGE